LLCTTISIDFNSQFHFLYVKESESEILERPESGVGNFGKLESESEILERLELESESDILPPTPPPCFLARRMEPAQSVSTLGELEAT